MNKKSFINQKNIAYILIAPIVVIFLILWYIRFKIIVSELFELVSGSYEFVGLKTMQRCLKMKYFARVCSTPVFI